jgi:hypothetical protein
MADATVTCDVCELLEFTSVRNTYISKHSLAFLDTLLV